MELSSISPFEADVTVTMETEDSQGIIQLFRTVITPALAATGIVGNILNIVALSSMIQTFRESRLEKFYYIMLTALASADMGFCAFVLPWAYISIAHRDFASGVKDNSFVLFYWMYSEFVIVFFACASTLITTSLSIFHFVSVKRPFIPGKYLAAKIITLVVALAVVLNIPRLFLYEKSLVDEESQLHVLYWRNDDFFYGYRIAYIVTAFAIPMLILIASTTGVLCHLNNMKHKQVVDSVEKPKPYQTSRAMKAILVAIVIEYMICSLPSQIAPFCYSHEINYDLLIEVTNAIGTSNFALNFVLYSVLSSTFRGYICARCCRKSVTEAKVVSLKTESYAEC